MGSTSIPHATVSQGFTNFPRLPIEIRRFVWSLATLRRPRTLQILYNPEKESWQACTDGCGGLPSIIPVSREARTEGLLGYIRILDTWLDLEKDTVFISDPLFCLRNPRKVFMGSEYVGKIKNIAFTNDVFRGLADSNERFPQLCDPPARILRNMKALQHFNLVLSEDGVGFSDWSDGSDIDDEDEFEYFIAHDTDSTQGHMNGEQADGNSLAPQVQGPAGTQTHRPSEMGPEDILDRLEERAMSTMTKGYFRHVGNIRFESAMANPDHWESWFLWRDEVVYHFEQEKADYPEWIQPKVSIMAVKYGLKTIGDYSREVHFQGDYNDEIVAGEEINSDADSQ